MVTVIITDFLKINAKKLQIEIFEKDLFCIYRVSKSMYFLKKDRRLFFGLKNSL